MDLQYLAARCNKGTAAVAAYMNDHHRYMKVNFLADAHADLIRWQKDLDAANGWLGCHLCLQFCCLWIECCDKRRGCQFLLFSQLAALCSPRTVLMIMDVTVWPARAWAAISCHFNLHGILCLLLPSTDCQICDRL